MDNDRETGREWREKITEWLSEKGAIVLDPYHKPMASASIHDSLEDDEHYEVIKNAIAKGDYDEVERRMKVVRATDLRLVDHSDFIIVNLDLDKRPCGTYEEVFTANRQKKPIITMCPQGKSSISPWLFGTFSHKLMFEQWGEVHSYLTHIDGAPDKEIETLNRWVFFDFEDQIKNII